jgi:hypothetical protein
MLFFFYRKEGRKIVLTKLHCITKQNPLALTTKCPLRMIIVLNNEPGQPLSAKIYSRHSHAANCSASKKMTNIDRKRPRAKSNSILSLTSEVSTDHLSLTETPTPAKKQRKAIPLLASPKNAPVAATSNNG